MPHLRCFWVGKNLPLVLSKPALIFNSLRACPDLKLAQDLPWSGATLGGKWTGRNLDNYGRKWFCQHCCQKKMQQYRQNQIVQIVLTKALQPWLQKWHPYGVLGFVNYPSLYGNTYIGNYFSFWKHNVLGFIGLQRLRFLEQDGGR